MYELSCPSCTSPSQYDFRDFLQMCPFCSTTFRLDLESGQKELYSDHYIVANGANAAQIKETVIEWLKRLDHSPKGAEKEYFITDVQGISSPYWIISADSHTLWKGLVRRQHRSRIDAGSGADYLIEQGQFRRSYRWAVSARSNICESWGLARLHAPKEDVRVDWDGFPLDSTFSRGNIQENTEDKRSAYDGREFFEFKYANGLPILSIQVDDQEALRRAKSHIEQYHLEMAKLNVDYLVDCRSEIDVAGIQLVHLPLWIVRYVYRPKTYLRYFVKPRERQVVLEGFNNGILKGELAVQHRDKLWVNATVCAVVAVLLLLLGLLWHPALILAAIFMGVVSGASAYIASVKASAAEQLQPKLSVPMGQG